MNRHRNDKHHRVPQVPSTLWVKGGRTLDEDHSSCTIEPHPAEEHFPAWLEASLIEGDANQLLVLYPNEASRKQALNVLSGHGLSVDTTHHLTLSRLVDLLHLDLKQPRKLQDGPGLFSVVHELTKQAAERGDLPLLFAPTSESRAWVPYLSLIHI